MMLKIYYRLSSLLFTSLIASRMLYSVRMIRSPALKTQHQSSVSTHEALQQYLPVVPPPPNRDTVNCSMIRTPPRAPPIGKGSRGTRFESNPDDVFHIEVQRPADSNHVIIDGDHGEQQQPRSFSAAEESYRRLHCAVIDGKLDTLRRLLIQSNIDVNSRSSTGNTAGHEVINNR